MPLKAPPQPDTDEIAYPASGVTVKLVVLPWFTVWAVAGEMLPPFPAVGVTV